MEFSEESPSTKKGDWAEAWVQLEGAGMLLKAIERKFADGSTLEMDPVIRWLSERNAALDNQRPVDLILEGKYHEVRAALDPN